MIQRNELRCKMVASTTIDGIEEKIEYWLKEVGLSAGDLLESQLYRHGKIYQFIVI